MKIGRHWQRCCSLFLWTNHSLSARTSRPAQSGSDVTWCGVGRRYWSGWCVVVDRRRWRAACLCPVALRRHWTTHVVVDTELDCVCGALDCIFCSCTLTAPHRLLACLHIKVSIYFSLVMGDTAVFSTQVNLYARPSLHISYNIYTRLRSDRRRQCFPYCLFVCVFSI